MIAPFELEGADMTLHAQPPKPKHTTLIQLACLSQDLRGFASDCEKGIGVHDRLSQMQVEIVKECSDLLVEIVGDGKRGLARLVEIRDAIHSMKERPVIT
jgi:hypothetical protein